MYHVPSPAQHDRNLASRGLPKRWPCHWCAPFRARARISFGLLVTVKATADCPFRDTTSVRGILNSAHPIAHTRFVGLANVDPPVPAYIPFSEIVQNHTDARWGHHRVGTIQHTPDSARQRMWGKSLPPGDAVIGVDTRSCGPHTGSRLRCSSAGS